MAPGNENRESFDENQDMRQSISQVAGRFSGYDTETFGKRRGCAKDPWGPTSRIRYSGHQDARYGRGSVSEKLRAPIARARDYDHRHGRCAMAVDSHARRAFDFPGKGRSSRPDERVGQKGDLTARPAG